jgi:hypothetical protein
MKFAAEMTADEKAQAAAAKAAALDTALDYLDAKLPKLDRKCLDAMFGAGNYRIVYPSW